MADTFRSFRIEGIQPLAQAIDEVDACLRQAVEAGDRRVLVDIRGLTGFPRPGLLARMGMVRRWAATCRGRLRVAMVSRADFIDIERFGVVVARGLGFDSNVFENEDDAIHWLEQEATLWSGPPPKF